MEHAKIRSKVQNQIQKTIELELKVILKNKMDNTKVCYLPYCFEIKHLIGIIFNMASYMMLHTNQQTLYMPNFQR